MRIFLTTDSLQNYIIALHALGAEVSFTEPEQCDGLLLPGGGDVDPARYGQELRGSRGIDPDRDRRELDAVSLFVDLGRPVLGICRGVQLLNVWFGGTLHQDIPDHSGTEGRDRLHGSVIEDAALRAVYGERFVINSAHHQAVDRLGTGLRPVQWADDGTIEALRHETLPVFGVQWHPERLREPTDGWKLLDWWLHSLPER